MSASFTKYPKRYYNRNQRNVCNSRRIIDQRTSSHKKNIPASVHTPTKLIEEDMKKDVFERSFEVVNDECWSQVEKEQKYRDVGKSLNMIYTVIDDDISAVAIPYNSHISYQTKDEEELCVFQPPILNSNEFIILERYVSKEFSRKLKSYSLTFDDFDTEIPRLAKVAITAPYIVYSIFKNLRDHDPTFKNYNQFNEIRYKIFKLAAKNILPDELITKIHDEYFPVIRDAIYNREEVIARFVRDIMYYIDTGKVPSHPFVNNPESNYFNKHYRFEKCSESKLFILINCIQLIKIYIFYIMPIPRTCYGNIYV